MVTEEGLQKFIDLYKRKYGITLEKEKALEMFSSLVNVVKIAYYGDER